MTARRRKPSVTVEHNPDGWPLEECDHGYPGYKRCNSVLARAAEGLPTCTDRPVWRVRESSRGLVSTGHYCDKDVPADLRGTVAPMTSEQPSANLRSPSAEKRARKASAMAGRARGVSARSVEMARTVTRYGPPGLVEKVVSGEISLNAAYQETRRFVIEARQRGADIDPACRIGGRIQPLNTTPCPHCKGTGRLDTE